MEDIPPQARQGGWRLINPDRPYGTGYAEHPKPTSNVTIHDADIRIDQPDQSHFSDYEQATLEVETWPHSYLELSTDSQQPPQQMVAQQQSLLPSFATNLEEVHDDQGLITAMDEQLQIMLSNVQSDRASGFDFKNPISSLTVQGGGIADLHNINTSTFSSGLASDTHPITSYQRDAITNVNNTAQGGFSFENFFTDYNLNAASSPTNPEFQLGFSEVELDSILNSFYETMPVAHAKNQSSESANLRSSSVSENYMKDEIGYNGLSVESASSFEETVKDTDVNVSVENAENNQSATRSPSLEEPMPHVNRDAHSNTAYAGIIVDYESYLQAKANQRSRLHSQPSDFPQTAAKQRAFVKKLYEAIQSCDDEAILDRGDKVKRPFKDVDFSGETLELTCWNIMMAAKDAQERGQVTKPSKDLKFEVFRTFTARMDNIVDACRISKAICRSVMSETFINRLVDQPAAEIGRKVGNQKLNDKKSLQNKAGRQALMDGHLAANDPRIQRGSLKENTVRARYARYVQEDTPGRDRGSKTLEYRKRAHAQNGNDDDDDVDETELNTVRPKRQRSTLAPMDRTENQATPTVAAPEAERLPAATTGFTLTRQAMFQHDLATKLSNMPPSVFPAVAVSPSGLSPVLTPPMLSALLKEYKKKICFCLGINEDQAGDLCLRDLRYYAFAYNEDFKDRRWTHPDWQQITFINAIPHSNLSSFGSMLPCAPHISHVMPRYGNIAAARNDVTSMGLYNPAGNMTFRNPFPNDPRGVNLKQALGLLDNPLGMLPSIVY